MPPHLDNLGAVLQKLLEVVDLSINVYGDVGEARAAVDPPGAVYHDQVVGFTPLLTSDPAGGHPSIDPPPRVAPGNDVLTS